MKQCIVQHSELQLNLIWAFYMGMKALWKNEDHHLSINTDGGDFEFRMYKYHKFEGSAVEGKLVLCHPVNKGAYMRNDVRLGVIVQHIEEEGAKFIAKCNEYLYSTAYVKS